MASGVLGRGTYQSVIAGVQHKVQGSKPVYYTSSWELLLLKEADSLVKKNLMIRDSIFHNKFPHAAAVNGRFKLTPPERHQWHADEVMPALRKRQFLLEKIYRQRRRNAQMSKEEVQTAQQEMATPDLALYVAPQNHKYTIAQPNFWQHETKKHLVPSQDWQRHPELGGITRVGRKPELSPQHA